MNWYLEVLKKYATFTGRARRKEYWFFMLFNMIASIVLSVIDVAIGTIDYQSGLGIISGIYTLAVFIPSLAVTVRRLHDTGRSGWWLLITLLPLIGLIVLLVFMCMDSQSGNALDSTTGSNKYGENPKIKDIK
ncbi:hypothetical protein BMT54_06885 [Pasteurellaceae bacterium 15-036681]|nr:hypothetical protein BMT54_06885 [Pasteurellaceae bacterium 15-036681]